MAEPPGARPVLTPRRAALLAALLALLVDLNALPGAFLGDDFAVVVRNPLVERLDLPAIFSTDYWGRGRDSGLYRPLTVLTFALNRLAFGADPWSYHLVNLLLHAGATFLAASTFAALGFAPPLASTAAALFAVHPVHADVVGIVVGRGELLVALFLFAGMRIALAGRRRWWPAVLACYGAALLSKEHAVVFLPLLMAAGAFAAGSASAAWRRDRALYALVLATTACWLLLRRGVLQPGFAPLLIYAADNPLHGAAFPVRALTAVKVNLLYLANLVLPLRLQSVYSGPGLNTVVGPSTWWNLAALAYAAGCAAATLHGWRRREAWGFGVPAYLIGFAVTANLFVPITVLMADRFAYLPSAGFCLCAAGVLLLPARRARSPLAGRVLLLLPVAYVVLLAGLTLGRNAVFQQPGEFWRSVVRTDPGNVRGWFFLAQSAAEAGRAAEADHALAEAIRADPSLPDVHIARSLLLLEQGRAAEAADAARTAMQKAPAGVGLAQYALAEAELALGRPAAALPLLEEVAAMFSEAPGWWAARGRALEALDRAPEAAESYRRSLELADDTELRRRLAGLLVRIGRRGDAADVLQPGVPPTP